MKVSVKPDSSVSGIEDRSFLGFDAQLGLGPSHLNLIGDFSE